MLRQAQLDKPEAAADRYAQARMQEMLDLIELVTGWFDELQQLDQDTVLQLMKLGGGVKKLVAAKQRLGGKSRRNTKTH